MAKAPRAAQKPTQDIDLHPDAWDRFTEFVKRIAKAGPQHRVKREVGSGEPTKPKPRRK